MPAISEILLPSYYKRRSSGARWLRRFVLVAGWPLDWRAAPSGARLMSHGEQRAVASG